MRPLSKAAPLLALGLSLLAGDAFAAAKSGGLDLAALREKLQAASARKHSGAEKVLRGNVWLRGRPTADADNAGNLSAGTVVRQSNLQVTNAAGIWRHVETQSGKNGWLLEADLAP